MNAAQSEKSKEKDPGTGRLREVLALVWELVKPRRGLLAVGFVLMGINRVAGLVLPASTKYLGDDVPGRRHVELLGLWVLAGVAATRAPGISSFPLTHDSPKRVRSWIR